MPWVAFEQNMRPERGARGVGKIQTGGIHHGTTFVRQFSRPFRAEGLFAFQSQGIALTRLPLGCILLAFQSITLSDIRAAF